MAPDKPKNRNVVHCLLCQKPQSNLPVHLSRVCLKSGSEAQRLQELQRAKASHRAWMWSSRRWDYERLRQILPNHSARSSLVEELLQRGFFIQNQPDSSEQDSPRTSNTATAGAVDALAVLRAARADFMGIYTNLQKGCLVSGSEKVLYRYYCEALLVYRHLLSPGAVRAFTEEQWVDRLPHKGRVVTGFRRRSEGSPQTAFALTLEEEAWFQLYFTQIRAENIDTEKSCNNFFISSSGEARSNITQDMGRFHGMYDLPFMQSYTLRRFVRATAKTLPTAQRAAVDFYLSHSAGDVQENLREPQPQELVDMAELLDSLLGYSSDEEICSANTRAASMKDFSEFVSSFPVSCGGQPPTKRKWLSAGFPENQVFYKKWRTVQYAQRQKYLLSQFTHQRPSAAEVEQVIGQEGWKANHPKPEEIVRLWKPAPKVPST